MTVSGGGDEPFVFFNKQEPTCFPGWFFFGKALLYLPDGISVQPNRCFLPSNPFKTNHF